jgi:hypothetical protein
MFKIHLQRLESMERPLPSFAVQLGFKLSASPEGHPHHYYEAARNSDCAVVNEWYISLTSAARDTQSAQDLDGQCVLVSTGYAAT